ncbi:MAG: hypothetical protein ABH854_05740 [Candidatus Diapherotrites archaeon]
MRNFKKLNSAQKRELMLEIEAYQLPKDVLHGGYQKNVYGEMKVKLARVRGELAKIRRRVP